MPGWLENRRKAKEEARQRAIAADNDANDRIAYGFVPARRDEPSAAPVSRPAPVTPPVTPPVRRPDPDPSEAEMPDFRPAGDTTPVTPPAPQAPAPAPTTPAELGPDAAVQELLGVTGALAAAVVAEDSGEVLAESSGPGFDLTIAAAGAVELLRTQRRILAEAGDDAKITDVQVTLSSRFELTSAATSAQAEGLVLYLALSRDTGNLAIARRRLASVSGALVG